MHFLPDRSKPIIAKNVFFRCFCVPFVKILLKLLEWVEKEQEGKTDSFKLESINKNFGAVESNHT